MLGSRRLGERNTLDGFFRGAAGQSLPERSLGRNTERVVSQDRGDAAVRATAEASDQAEVGPEIAEGATVCAKRPREEGDVVAEEAGEGREPAELAEADGGGPPDPPSETAESVYSAQAGEMGKNSEGKPGNAPNTKNNPATKGNTKGDSGTKNIKSYAAILTPGHKQRGLTQGTQQNKGDSPPGKRVCSQSTPPEYIKDTRPRQRQEAGDSLFENLAQSSPDTEFKEERETSSMGKMSEEMKRVLDLRIQSLLSSLPTRQDLDSALNAKLEIQSERLEQFVEHKVSNVQEEVAKLGNKLSVMEEDLKNARSTMISIGESTQETRNIVVNLAMQVLDLENRSRRDNVRLRGIPETVGADIFEATVTSIFNYYLSRPLEEPIKIDRLHRALATRNIRNGPPRDVICKLHNFPQKDAIIRGGWEKGPFEVQGSQVIILQDLAPKTLGMRKILKPLVDIVKSKAIPL